jgi:hypothetical protein
VDKNIRSGACACSLNNFMLSSHEKNAISKDTCETSVASATDHVVSGHGKSSEHSGGTEKFTNHYTVDACHRKSFKMIILYE